MSLPIATTAMSNSWTPSWRIASTVGGVGVHHVRQPVGPLGHPRLVVVDGQHLVPEPDQRLGDGAAEAAEPDDEHGVVAQLGARIRAAAEEV